MIKKLFKRNRSSADQNPAVAEDLLTLKETIIDWRPGVYSDAMIWVSRKMKQMDLQPAPRL